MLWLFIIMHWMCEYNPFSESKQLMLIPEKAWTAQSERSYKRFVNQAKDHRFW
jgi:hypothetical protein